MPFCNPCSQVLKAVSLEAEARGEELNEELAELHTRLLLSPQAPVGAEARCHDQAFERRLCVTEFDAVQISQSIGLTCNA